MTETYVGSRAAAIAATIASIYGTCYGCGTAVSGVGVAYCDACITEQLAAYFGGSELAAFDAYHRAVDALR